MNTQNTRFFLLAFLILLGVLLYSNWKQEEKARYHEQQSTTVAQSVNNLQADQDIPTRFVGESPTAVPEPIHHASTSEELIDVTTDVFRLKIDPKGGDIVWVLLTQYAESQDSYGEGFLLMDNTGSRYYVAQSGLSGEDGPDVRGVGRAHLQASAKHFSLKDGEESLVVDLTTKTKGQVDITKRFTFSRGSYVIGVEYLIANQGSKPYQASFYARLKRKDSTGANGRFLGAQTFTGAAIHTEDTPFKKLKFSDLEKQPVEQSVKGGWAAMVEHYFLSAWIPTGESTNLYSAQKGNDDTFSVGLVEPSFSVVPGEQTALGARLYAGPEIISTLESLAPGLELSVDYGILWPICRPIFWVLEKMFELTKNWGVAIILTTVLIKLLFFKLSASSYRSMGRMRKIQPRITALKERCGEDKQKFSQEMMALYRKEKINPLSGCLPILVQIPVFIALYYVLLGSIELREAPFMGWIQDLSAKDPYYILPLLMGASMFVQQKLNPAPPDPVQAKVMMLMPIVFTVLFLNFPSGLVLYWLVNNLLSLAQQWFITRRVESVLKSHGDK